MRDRNPDIEARVEARLGTVLRGKYRLDRVLGIGGMAVVYKATHRNQAEFAVKILHPEVSLSADIRSRFLREGYAANSIKHPGAVLVVDDDVAEDGAAFLVMELLDGMGCDELWERSGKRISSNVACAIVLQLLDVLEAAHVKETVHRDIKPANLFLTRNGTVKVLDFGIARARDAMTTGGHATASGVTLGTPAFMAPEQARGRMRDVDRRTDLWAAGATFFALVSGELVHPEETAHELIFSSATKPARSLATIVPAVPASIVAVIDRALAFGKEDRWQTAAEMRAALFHATREHFGASSPEAVVASALQQRTVGNAAVSPTAPTLESDSASAVGRLPAPPPTAKSLQSGSSTYLSSEQGPRPQPSGRTRSRAVPVGLALAGTVALGLWVATGLHRNVGTGSAVAEPGGAVEIQQDRDGSGVERESGAQARTPVSIAAPPSASTRAQTATSHSTSVPAHSLVRPPSMPAKPNCDPNWYMESGIKKYKPECPLN
jgi:serine/threonine-protein kinase